MATILTVTPDYFRAMAIPLVSGRAFDDADDGKAEPVAVVNWLATSRLLRSNPLDALREE